MALSRGELRFVGGVAAVCTLGAWAWWVEKGGGEEALRALARITARVGFLFFAGAFFGASLRRLRPHPVTHWLVAHRRMLGLSFATVHATHMAAIGALALQGAPLGVAPLSIGWLALLFVAIMAATSNDASQRWLGAAWGRLHTVGGYLVAYVFGLSFLSAAGQSIVAAGELALLGAGLFCRFSARGTPILVLGSCLSCCTVGAEPADRSAVPEHPSGSDAVIDQTHLEPDMAQAASADHPYGRAHPAAAPQLEQFAFLVGDFDCHERIRRESGAVLAFRARWRGRYILGGFGIQDEYWTARVFATSVRVFDPAADTWVVDFVRMPGYATSSWRGRQRGDRMVMRRPESEQDGPAFSHITADGFEWHSGGGDPSWTSSCRRRAVGEDGPNPR